MGTPVKLGSEFHINTETTNSQFEPSIASLSGGGYVVTWTSRDQDGGGIGVFGQRYNASGNKVGIEFQVNSETTEDQQDVSVSALKGGGFVAVWMSEEQDGAEDGVYGQRFAANGSKVGSEFRVNTFTSDDQRFPEVAGLPDGGYFVTWYSNTQDLSGHGIYGQRYDANGDKVGSEFRINTETINSQYYPSVAVLEDGRIVVSWASWEQEGVGQSTGIYGQEYKAQLFGTKNGDNLSDDVGANWMDGRGGNDVLKGKSGNDFMYGQNGKDKLKGGNDNDKLWGGKQNDKLYGDKGKDTIKGGDGNDLIYGGKHDDKLYGNDGKDIFAFKKKDGKDTIYDFENGKDKIDLSGLKFSSKSQALDEFYEIGNNHDNKLGFNYKGTKIVIKGIDMDDLGGSDIII